MATLEGINPGGRDVIVIGTHESPAHFRRRMARYRRLRREALAEQERLNAPGNVTLTAAQAEMLTPQQRSQFRQLNQTEQLRYQRELQHSLMQHRREVAEARQRTQRQRARQIAKTGAFSSPAPIGQPPTGSPMDAITARGASLPTHKRRRTAGVRPLRL